MNPAADDTLDIFPHADAFEPYTRPPRKQTNIPNFPPGFSPFDDTRDPGADPTAYPSPTTKHFKNFLGRSRVNAERWAEGWATGPLHIWESLFSEGPIKSLWNSFLWKSSLWKSSLVNTWKRILNVSELVKRTTIATTAPFICVYLYARIIDLWRHGVGLLVYTFYYISAVNGKVDQTKCWRVLREGPNRRFTVTSQFWFRRGCDGSTEGLAARSYSKDEVATPTLTKSIRLLTSPVLGSYRWASLGHCFGHAARYSPCYFAHPCEYTLHSSRSAAHCRQTSFG